MVLIYILSWQECFKILLTINTISDFISAAVNFQSHSVEIESDSAASSNHRVKFDLLADDSSKSGALEISLGSSPTYKLACMTVAKPLTLSGSKWTYTLEKRTASIAFYVNGALVENMVSLSCAEATWTKTTTKFRLANDDTATDKITFIPNGRFLEVASKYSSIGSLRPSTALQCILPT